MDKEELKKLMRSRLENIRPFIEETTNAMMECYMQGLRIAGEY